MFLFFFISKRQSSYECFFFSYRLILYCWFSQVNVDHIDRFLKEFGTQEVEDDEDELSQQTQGNSKANKSSKPSDFLELFGGKRDEEDHFMFGIKFTR